ncbi:hypothetical protein AB4Z46_07960 [Variovorax sp. M-6]
MEKSNILIFAAMLAVTSHATAQVGVPSPAASTFVVPSIARIDAVSQPDADESFKSPGAALNLTLPPEAISTFKMSLPDPNSQRQAWCVQQSQIRPESTGSSGAGARIATGCYDRSVAVSGRDFFISSAVELAVRKARSAFSD